MRIDPLKQYAKLRHELLTEKGRLETRLQEINQGLGSDVSPAPVTPARVPQTRSRRGRRPRAQNQLSLREAITQALAAKGPLGRKELAAAVADVGYISNAKDPMASMGVFLYSKKSPFKRKKGKFYLSGTSGSRAAVSSDSPDAIENKSGMSPEGRARISAAQKARWARLKRAK